MKRTGFVGLLLLTAAACSSARGGGGGIVTEDDAGDASTMPDTMAMPDAETPDVPVKPDVAQPDVAQPDVVTPDVPVKPDVVVPDGAGRCMRDSECSGSSFCDSASGMCMPLVCTPGRTTCVNAMRARTCDGRGAAFMEMDCPGGCASNVCSGGMSTCSAPMAMCGSVCVNTQTDATNCGACGRACTAGQSCVTGVCTGGSTCTAPMTMCSGLCVNTQTDASNCGLCGRVCPTGQACSAGACTTTCASPRTMCSGLCVDTLTDASNCGLCGRVCPTGQTCTAGTCTATTACTAPLLRCGTVCTNPAADPANCGACGRACPSGQTCSAGTCMALGTGTGFQIVSLGTTGCNVVDHNTNSGDDRGGIAVGASSMLYSGDTSTVRFDPDTLAQTALGSILDGLCSNLRSGTMYTLATSATMPVGASGGTVTHLIELDALTGRPTTRFIALSMPLTLPNDTGIFSGWDRVVIAANGHVYNVALPAGTVTDLGAMVFPSHMTCENWAFWGVAEYIGGRVSLAYVEGSTRVARVSVPDGAVTTVGTFTNLSDMCSFTVDPRRNRWYFHHESSSQFGGVSETAGFCPASLNAGGAVTCTSPMVMCGGGCVDTQNDAANCGACGRACTSGQSCRAGVCSTISTGTNYTLTTPPSTVSFVDVCAMTGAAHVLASADDSQVLTPLAFSFPFWGAALPVGQMVNITTNGYISLDGMAGVLTSGTIPATSTPNGVIAAFWRDLVTQTAGVCHITTGTAPNRRFLVEWSGTRLYGGATTATITTEIALNEADGTIDILTQSNTFATGTTATVGVENIAGTRAVGGCTPSTTTTCAAPTGNRLRFTPSP